MHDTWCLSFKGMSILCKNKCITCTCTIIRDGGMIGFMYSYDIKILGIEIIIHCK